MRILSSTFITLALLAAPTFASAHDVKKKTPVTDIADIKFPTEAEIEDIIDQMPDMNKLMGAMMEIAKDEDIHEALKMAGQNFGDKMEKSGLTDMELKDREMPDFNALLATMMRTFSDEDMMGDFVGIASKMQEAVEENIDEDMLKPKKD